MFERVSVAWINSNKKQRVSVKVYPGQTLQSNRVECLRHYTPEFGEFLSAFFKDYQHVPEDVSNKLIPEHLTDLELFKIYCFHDLDQQDDSVWKEVSRFDSKQ